uniref:Integrase core domain containing protein n=1 Tax=Solanum tuberosum TaxID=4113 RepID=M1DME1_SOLTU
MQMITTRGLFIGLPFEDPYAHLSKVVSVCHSSVDGLDLDMDVITLRYLRSSPNHKIDDESLMEILYRALGDNGKAMVDTITGGSLMRNSFEQVVEKLKEVAKTNKAWSTRGHNADKVNAVNYKKRAPPQDDYGYEKDAYYVNDHHTGGFRTNAQAFNKDSWRQDFDRSGLVSVPVYLVPVESVRVQFDRVSEYVTKRNLGFYSVDPVWLDPIPIRFRSGLNLFNG